LYILHNETENTFGGKLTEKENKHMFVEAGPFADAIIYVKGGGF
jgi:hypothetical protein